MAWPVPRPRKGHRDLERTNHSDSRSPSARTPPAPKRPGFVLMVEGLSRGGRGCRTPQTLLGKR